MGIMAMVTFKTPVALFGYWLKMGFGWSTLACVGSIAWAAVVCIWTPKMTNKVAMDA